MFALLSPRKAELRPYIANIGAAIMTSHYQENRAAFEPKADGGAGKQRQKLHSGVRRVSEEMGSCIKEKIKAFLLLCFSVHLL